MRIPFKPEEPAGFVIAARPQSDYTRLYEMIGICRDPLVVCADGGAGIAESLKIPFSLTIGDGDSGGHVRNNKDISLPPEKDVTDTHAAVDLLLQQGCRTVVICCCTGGRLDHELANILLLEHIYTQKAQGCLIDGQNEVVYAKAPFEAAVDAGGYQYLSIIPLDDRLTGVDMTGFKYPLHNHTVVRGDSLTVSNEPLEGAQIKIRSGRALVIVSRD